MTVTVRVILESALNVVIRVVTVPAELVILVVMQLSALNVVTLLLPLPSVEVIDPSDGNVVVHAETLSCAVSILSSFFLSAADQCNQGTCGYPERVLSAAR